MEAEALTQMASIFPSLSRSVAAVGAARNEKGAHATARFATAEKRGWHN
jgi:hypothetical protein